MDSRREFLKKAVLLSGAAGFSGAVPASIQRALSINPAPGSTYLDAEHIVILMQENRSFDHCFGTLQGVRGFNDPRAAILPDKKPVWMQTNEKGDTYSPFRLNIKDSKVTWMGDLPHSRASQVDAYNKGRYDQWLPSKRSNNKQYADMPLTLGYYNRADLPFNYAMADAFTVCDQNFCSAMTSTTPNRSFFWTGNIMQEQDGLMKAHIRNTDYSYAKLGWQTFPELLQKEGIPWKFYQNEISCGGGFKGTERSWLSNFGCNLLEFFAAYNVKFAPYYVQNLQIQIDTLPGEINKLQEESPSSEDAAKKIKVEIAKKQEVLDKARAELVTWSRENFAKLSDEEKNLYANAFVTNTGDRDYRSITNFTYKEGNQDRELTIPAGDVLHQFREDVNNGKLPMVSWLASPQNFSDHPSAPWYGAWYVSEVLDILTKNPEVWKKTIFIVTYDENDGYYDHVVPFSIPDNKLAQTGKCSAGIETEIEHVRLENEIKQGIPQSQAREGAVGLGFRVPMIIASPWSRGGRVCSQVFDHTSTLQFLESFIKEKYKKDIRQDTISQWRRTICGDLSSVFSEYNGKQLKPLPFLQKENFVQDIYNAKFRDVPGGFRKLNDEEIKSAINNTHIINLTAEQEKGVRPSCALPYELYADGNINVVDEAFEIQMTAGKEVFGAKSAGSPFTVVVPGIFDPGDGKVETSRSWSFAVSAGDTVRYQWPLKGFGNSAAHLRLYGPNGFYREFVSGTKTDLPEIVFQYEKVRNKVELTGNVILKINNAGARALTILITDHSYKVNTVEKAIPAKSVAQVVLNLNKSFGWYDFSVAVKGEGKFRKRYAGRVETGKETFTDPFMGRVV